MKTLLFVILSLLLTARNFAADKTASTKAANVSAIVLGSGSKTTGTKSKSTTSNSISSIMFGESKSAQKSGGGVIGDGGEIVTLPSGEKVPKDFIVEFKGKQIPASFQPINLEKDFPDVFAELKKLKDFLFGRSLLSDMRTVMGKFVPFIPSADFYPYFYWGASDLDNFNFYLVDQTSCKETDGCAYVFSTYNTQSFKTDYLKVIELKKSTMNNSSISSRTKALLVFHEILHHNKSIRRLISEYEDIHKLISPLVKNLHIGENAFKRQQECFKNSKELYELTEEEYRALIALHKIISIIQGINDSSCVFRSGGGVAYNADERICLDRSNYVFMDSAIKMTPDVQFRDNVVRNSVLSIIDNLVINTSIENSKIDVEKTVGNIFENAIITNSIVDPNSIIECRNCRLENSRIRESSISGKWAFVVDSKINNSYIKNTNLIKTEIQGYLSRNESDDNATLTFDKCWLDGSYLKTPLINKAINPVTIKNANFYLAYAELTIDKNADKEMVFDPQKKFSMHTIYKDQFFGRTKKYEPVLKSVEQFENDYPQFIEQK